MASNEHLLPKFDSIKDDNETILWTDKPKFIPYTITALGLGSGVIIILCMYYVMIKDIQFADPTGLFSIWFAGIPIIAVLWSFLSKLLSFKNTYYAYTNKRVMLRTGFIGTDFKIIDYDKISDIQVSVNLIERLFNVGTIKFYSGRSESNEGITTKLYDRWEAISSPYEIFKQLKTISLDIKTDFNYPNALRPDTNPGYNTKYNPKH